MQFLTPEEQARLALKRHIESLPDWMEDQIRWCSKHLEETHRPFVPKSSPLSDMEDYPFYLDEPEKKPFTWPTIQQQLDYWKDKE